MVDLLCLFLLTITPAIVMPGTVHQFPPSVNVSSGDTVNMYCQLNQVQSFCHTLAWVRVHPMTGTIDFLPDSNVHQQTKENTVCQVSIYNAVAHDSGTYYCVTTDREHMYLGNGTTVTVQADSTGMPSIDITAFVSSNNHEASVTLQCSVEGFAPSQIYMHWQIGSRKDKGQTSYVWEVGNEIKTYAELSAEEWKTGQETTCFVKFAGLTFNKTLSHYDIQGTCYPLICLTRKIALVVALLFLIGSTLIAGRF